MRKEISVDIFGDKDALKIVKEEIAAAKSSNDEVDLKIEITGYFPASYSTKKGNANSTPCD